MVGKRLASPVFIVIIAFFSLLGAATAVFGQELSGRWEGELSLVPQTTSRETALLEFEPSSQLDWSLDYEGLGFDNTLYFTNAGLSLVWFGWEATFPTGEVREAVVKRTLAQNDWVKVVRSFPSPVRPGEVVEVTIIVEALQTIPPGTVIEIIEELPRGWGLEPLEPLGVRLAKEAHRWTVTLGDPGTRETIRYIAYVPRDAAAGSYTIIGTVRSVLFPDLDFSDTVEVVIAPLPIPARVRLSQDLIFSTKVSRGVLVEPLAFRAMYFDSYVTLERDPKFTNYFDLYNVGTAQTPSLSWRDTVILEGKTEEGVRAKLALRFTSEGRGFRFDRGSLRISTISLAELDLQSAVEFDKEGFKRARTYISYNTEFYDFLAYFRAGLVCNEDLNLELETFNLRLSGRFDGLFRWYDYYGRLEYDEIDGDGIEEDHFELTRRRVYLAFSLDKLDVRSASMIRPIIEDIDGDGADEKVVDLKWTRQDLLIRRSLEKIRFTGYFTFSAEKAIDEAIAAAGTPAEAIAGVRAAPLRLSRVRFNLLFIYGEVKFTSDTVLDLEDYGFAETLKVTVGF